MIARGAGAPLWRLSLLRGMVDGGRGLWDIITGKNPVKKEGRKWATYS